MQGKSGGPRSPDGLGEFTVMRVAEIFLAGFKTLALDQNLTRRGNDMGKKRFQDIFHCPYCCLCGISSKTQFEAHIKKVHGKTVKAEHYRGLPFGKDSRLVDKNGNVTGV